MANTPITIADKQFLAKTLFTKEHLDQKTICKKVGVSEKTMSDWVNKFNWKALKNRLLIGKEENINVLYEQLEQLNNAIKKNESKHADTKQADILIKYTAAIRNLETDLAIADLVEAGIRFIRHTQATASIDETVLATELWYNFLQASIKK